MFEDSDAVIKGTPHGLSSHCVGRNRVAGITWIFRHISNPSADHMNVTSKDICCRVGSRYCHDLLGAGAGSCVQGTNVVLVHNNPPHMYVAGEPLQE